MDRVRSALIYTLRTPICHDMVTHMKTTIEISDPLLERAKRVAAREGTTLRTLVEQGLRSVLAERGTRSEFRLRKASFRGKGLQPDARALPWDRIRELAYQGRGG
jgi:Arc/MetJ family transcription regulator